MSRIFIVVLFAVISLGLAESAFSQTSERTRELVAALDKTKYKKKEKKGEVLEIYINIKNEAIVKSSAAEYAGRYGSDDGDYRLDLTVRGDAVEGGGTDMYFEDSDFSKPRIRKFTLQGGRIDGALLTATKVYENGQTRNFEAVFVKRTSETGSNPDRLDLRETQYGIGFVESNDTMSNRVFLEFKR